MVQINPKHILVQKILSLPVRGSGFVGLLLARFLFPKLQGTVITSTLYGFDIWVNGKTDALIERQVYYTGTYEKGTIYMIKQLLDKGDVFVDAGANIGLMSLVASTCVGEEGQVYAFEPFPIMYDRFLANIQLNQFTNITVYPTALAAEAGEALLYPDAKHNPGASSLVNRNTQSDPVHIQKQKLDAYSFAGNNIAVIKIDVEGYELEVLKGATGILKKPEAPAIIVECSIDRENFEYSAADLFEFIKGINAYRVFILQRGKGHVSCLVEVKAAADLPAHDNLFCFLPAHLNKIAHD